MSRRSALKRMGIAVASALISSTGVISLTSCRNKDVKRAFFILQVQAIVCMLPVNSAEKTPSC